MVKLLDTRIGQQLISRGYIGEDQLNIALIEQRKTGQKLGRILLQYGFVSESRLRRTLGKMSGVKSLDLKKIQQDSAALDMVSRDFAVSNSVLPIHFDPSLHRLTVAMSEPGNLSIQDKLRRLLGNNIAINVVHADESAIEQSAEKFYGVQHSIGSIIDELEQPVSDSPETIDVESRKIVQLVQLLLADAVRCLASDLHLEPEKGFVRIRYRIDGVLCSIRSLHIRYWSAIAGRLKVLSGMDIAESRTPQDGSFSLTVQAKNIDFRVSSFPVVSGENLVLRILDQNKSVLGIGELEQSPSTLTVLKQVLAVPDGIVLVAGPTGSGKTTTLYSLLSELNTDAVNIMTLEDPVEYSLGRIRQSSISKNSNLNFHDGIRAIMRQDPDIILVGEIRDAETALISLRAAMTGHKVFSSIHTRSALSTVQRLIDLGVKSTMLAGNLTAVISQRLIRLICDSCDGFGDEDRKQCRACLGTGYRGRRAIMEVLQMDNTLDHLMASGAPLIEIESAARRKGWVPLAEQALKLQEQGLTDTQEVHRVVGWI